MSFVDPWHGERALDPVRRQYCFKLSSSDLTFYIRDQVQCNVPMRVSANAVLTTAQNYNNTTSNQVLELRLYDAFGTDRVYNDTNDGDYIVLGYFYVNAKPVSGTFPPQWWFKRNHAIPTLVMNTKWRFVVYDIFSGTAWSKSGGMLGSVTVDVRSGGSTEWTD